MKKLIWIPILVAAVIGWAYLFRFAWNSAVVPAFQLPVISLWQGVGIVFVAQTLIGYRRK